MSNLKEIIAKLEKTNEKWLNNSKCFDELIKLYNEEEFTDNIIISCENLNNKNKALEFNKLYWNRRNKLTFTQKDKENKIDSNEVFLERVYTYFQNKKNGEDKHKFHNQYKIGKSCKEAVDIRVDENGNIEYIELKCLNSRGSADTPIVALIESLKNYYLSNEKEKITKLTILAPMDYWNKKITKESEFIFFNDVIQNLNKKLKKSNVKIQIKTFPFVTSDLNEILKELDKNLEFSPALHKNNQYDSIATISLDMVWDNIKGLKIFRKMDSKQIFKYSDININTKSDVSL